MIFKNCISVFLKIYELEILCKLLLTKLNKTTQLTNSLPETNTKQPTNPELSLFGKLSGNRRDYTKCF